MSKVHLQSATKVAPHCKIEAAKAWKREGIIPNDVRACDKLMVRVDRAETLTEYHAAVTCKHCLKIINNG